MAAVLLTDDAREDLRGMDGAQRKLVLKALKKLEDSPEHRGAPLGSRSRGDLTSFRKLVVGDRDYRIVYRVERDGTVVVVWVIAGRADDRCYELAMSRLRLRGGAIAAEIVQLLDTAWQRGG
ncbi:type II toxin-antitoxin system RelE family toxin [Sciscionella sediminilitoris]|uniref:type II toxin-antitoxin system RelE family toxin n=1 Tax=Sciscionella sediminilitoris TaxID=1445613 RepID=UPI00055E7976|nr:type II toxin-antitoxin system RelE/ParE family toxin [Sciscionella sp. SE31]